MACRNHPEKQEWNKDVGLCDECAAKEGSRLYEEQSGKCAICAAPLGKRDYVSRVYSSAKLDHNHHTGQIRGVLCQRCNLGLDHFQDDPVLLHAASAYLLKWQQLT